MRLSHTNSHAPLIMPLLSPLSPRLCHLCHLRAGDHPTGFAEYAAMRDALNATGRPMFFSLCGWNAWYAPVGAALGNR